MAFPVVAASIITDIGTSLGSNNAQTLPTGSTTGDLCLAFAVIDIPGAVDLTASTGWLTVFHVTQTGGARKMACFGRVLDGGANDALAVSGFTDDYVVGILRITGHGVTNANLLTAIKVAAASPENTAGNADPPSLDAGSVKDWLWVASCVVDMGSSGAGISSGSPTGYTEVDNRSATGNQAIGLGIAWLGKTIQTEDPGPFANTTDDWVAKTIAVPPVEGAAPIDLVVANATHTLTSDNITLEVFGDLVVASAAHTNTVEAVALVQAHVLTVANASHVHSVDNVILTLPGVGTVTTVEWITAGGVFETTATVKGQLVVTGGLPVLQVSTSAALTSPVTVNGTAIGVENLYEFALTGLSANTEYHYGFAGVKQGDFFTAPTPGTAYSYTMVGASCHNPAIGVNNNSLVRMAAKNPRLVMFMGDNYYPNPNEADVDDVRGDVLDGFDDAEAKALIGGAQFIWQASDHDVDVDDGDENSIGIAPCQEAYRQIFPNYPLPTNEMYYMFAYGRTRWVILDCFSHRDVELAGPEMLGTVQRTWLQGVVEAADEPLIFLCVEEPWIIDGEDNGWDIYPVDRLWVANLLEANGGHDRFILLHGDAHMLAYDDGTNSQYASGATTDGPVVVCFAPLNQTNSVKGGPYTEGPFTSSQRQYGQIDVVDDATTVTITIKGYSVTSSTTETQQFSHVHTYTESVAVDLVVASATHTHTAEAAPLVQNYALVVASATHTQTAEAAPLTQQYSLVVASAAHTQTADGAVLTQVHVLSVDNTTHTQVTETAPLTQAHVLVVASATHTQTVDGPTLTQVHVLVVASAVHGHTADEAPLSTLDSLGVHNASHGHVVDEIVLVPSYTLTVSSAQHVHVADAAVLVSGYTLTVDSTQHGHTADAVVLVLGYALTVSSAQHGHTADAVALTQNYALVVASAQHGHVVSNVALTIPLDDEGITINEAVALYIGATVAQAVYLGSTKVWP